MLSSQKMDWASLFYRSRGPHWAMTIKHIIILGLFWQNLYINSYENKWLHAELNSKITAVID